MHGEDLSVNSRITQYSLTVGSYLSNRIGQNASITMSIRGSIKINDGR